MIVPCGTGGSILVEKHFRLAAKAIQEARGLYVAFQIAKNT
jgi:hypothetical protein